MPVITPAHLHVLLNHIPIIGVPMIALLLFWGIIRHQDAVIRAALYGAVLMAAGTWVVDLTGDGAKDNIKDLPWAQRDTIREHEDSADFALPAAVVTGVAALILLVVARGSKPIHRGGAIGVLLALLFTATVLARTAWLGGMIRHAEFVVGSAGPP